MSLWLDQKNTFDEWYTLSKFKELVNIHGIWWFSLISFTTQSFMQKYLLQPKFQIMF
jgi:hypothetical protein